MAKKVCKKCGELNTISSYMCCSCNTSLNNAEVVGELVSDEQDRKKQICTSCKEPMPYGNRTCKNCGEFITKTDTAYRPAGYQPTNRYTMSYRDDDISIGIWVLILIGLAIPFLNILILLFIAFGSQNKTLGNFGKAALILILIGLILALFLGFFRMW